MNPKPLKMLFIGAAALASSSGYASDSDRFVTASVSAVKLRLKHVDQSQSESANYKYNSLKYYKTLLTDATERVIADRNQARWEADEKWYIKLQKYVTSDPINVQLEEVQWQLNDVLFLKRKFKELDHKYPDSLTGEKLKQKVAMAFGEAWTDASATKKIELADKLLKLRFMLDDFDKGVDSVELPTHGIREGSYSFNLKDKVFFYHFLPDEDSRLRKLYSLLLRIGF